MRFSHTFASSGETRYHSDRRLLENTGRARPKNVLSPRTVHVSRGHRREMRAILPTRRFRAPYYPTISVSLTNVYSGLFGKPKRANFDFFFFGFYCVFFGFYCVLRRRSFRLIIRARDMARWRYESVYDYYVRGRIASSDGKSDGFSNPDSTNAPAFDCDFILFSIRLS